MPREKYRVHEVAKDFGLNSKKILAILDTHMPAERTHMAALEDRELDIIFETVTQENAVESFDAYFAAGEKKKAEEEAKKAEAAEVKAEAPKAEKADKKPAKPEGKKDAKGDRKPEAKKDDRKPQQNQNKQQGNQNKPQQKNAPAKDNAPQQNKQEKLIQARTKGEKRYVDTRSSNVDLEKYNEKYDEMASQGGRRDNDMGAGKQKLKQKSQQYRKQQGMRSKRKESEAERLKRIEAERAKKTLVITVPEEITVGDLAAMLKRTAAEVIKKLFSLGMMATVNQVIDYDTAYLVADELGAKVNHEITVTIEDKLFTENAYYPIYLKKGEKLFYNIEA